MEKTGIQVLEGLKYREQLQNKNDAFTRTIIKHGKDEFTIETTWNNTGKTNIQDMNLEQAVAVLDNHEGPSAYVKLKEKF